MQHNVNRRRTAAVVAGLAVLSLVAAACGSDDQGAADTAAPAATEASTETQVPAATDAPAATGAPSDTEAPAETEAPVETSAAPDKSEVKVGVVATLTGFGSEGSENLLTALDVWEQHVNDTGGINGHPVAVEVKDSKGDPAAEQAAANELLADDAVIYGLILSQTEAQTANVWDPGGLTFGGVGFDLTVWGAMLHAFNPNTSQIPTVIAQPLSATLTESTTFGVAVCAEVPACAQAEGLLKPTAESMGLTYAGTFKVSGSQPDYVAECVKAISDGVDFMQLDSAADVQTRMATDCLDQGYEGWLGMPGGVSDDVQAIDGAKVANPLLSFPYFADAPAVQEYRDIFEQYAPGDEDAMRAGPGAWANLELFRTAVADTLSDAPTRDEVFAAFHTVKDEDLGGLLPMSVTYTEGEPTPTVKCLFIYKWQDGEFSLLDDGGPSGNSVTSGDLKSNCSAGG